MMEQGFGTCQWMGPFWVQAPHSFEGRKQIALGFPCHPGAAFHKVVVVSMWALAAALRHVWPPEGSLHRDHGEHRPEKRFQPGSLQPLPPWAASGVT